MTTQGETRLCHNGHQVSAGQRFCGDCGAEVAGSADGSSASVSASTSFIGRHKVLSLLVGVIVVLLVGGVVAVVLLTGTSEGRKHHPKANGVSLDQIIHAACRTGHATDQGSTEPGTIGYYRCDQYTFIRIFNSPAALQAWASGQSCTSGYAVAGPNWIVTGIGDPTRASALVKLGGAMAC